MTLRFSLLYPMTDSDPRCQKQQNIWSTLHTTDVRNMNGWRWWWRIIFNLTNTNANPQPTTKEESNSSSRIWSKKTKKRECLSLSMVLIFQSIYWSILSIAIIPNINNIDYMNILADPRSICSIRLCK